MALRLMRLFYTGPQLQPYTLARTNEHTYSEAIHVKSAKYRLVSVTLRVT